MLLGSWGSWGFRLLQDLGLGFRVQGLGLGLKGWAAGVFCRHNIEA